MNLTQQNVYISAQLVAILYEGSIRRVGWAETKDCQRK